MPAPIRIGTLGCGRIVHKALFGVVRDSTRCQLHAVASERPGVAAEKAREFQALRAYESYQQLLDDPQVDAVYIPCTGELHHPWTLAAIAAGKHVLCEKPLTRTLGEALELVQASRERGVILQEAFMWRLSPRVQRVKSMVDAGEIGDLRLLNVSFSFNIDRSDWRLKSEKGGGAMWDIGCYGVNAARYFTAHEPEAIEADAHWSAAGIDLSMRIGMTFPGGTLANIDCSFEVPWRCRAELVGTNGRIVLENAFQSFPEATIFVQRGTRRESPCEVIPVPDSNHYLHQLDHFCLSIEAGRLLAPAEDGLANMAALERVLAAARSRLAG